MWWHIFLLTMSWHSTGNLKYTDKERSRKWLMTRGLYLPKVRGVIYSSGNKILSKDDLVKPQYATHSAASDDKDLSGSCFAKDGSLERHSKRDELFLTANFSRRLELHYEGIATGGVC